MIKKHVVKDMDGDSEVVGQYENGQIVIALVYFFLSSFLVAAFVEEMCKYYGFLVMDHPDMFQDFHLFLRNIVNENLEEGIGDDMEKDEDTNAAVVGDSTSHESSHKTPDQLLTLPNTDDPITALSSTTADHDNTDPTTTPNSF